MAGEPGNGGPLQALGLAPFVPSGPDYDTSRRLFAELGFVEEWENDGYAGLRCGAVRVILQRLDDARFASQYMLRLQVPDLDAWWREISAKSLDARFPGFRIKLPTDYPWGREVHFIDLAGVCWHVAEGT